MKPLPPSDGTTPHARPRGRSVRVSNFNGAAAQTFIPLAGRLHASQWKVSPYFVDTTLKPAGRSSKNTLSLPFGCDRTATPVSAQSGHRKISVQWSETVIHENICRSN